MRAAGHDVTGHVWAGQPQKMSEKLLKAAIKASELIFSEFIALRPFHITHLLSDS